MNHRFLFYFIILEILFFSGEMRIYYDVLGNHICVMLFLLTTIIYNYQINKRLVLIRRNFSILKLLVIIIILSSFFFNHDTTSYKWVGIIAYLTGMCLFISSVSFHSFREGLLKISSILAIISIIVQIGHDIGIISATMHYVNDKRYMYSLYIFNTEWGGMNRLSSIYWEPGQYQIILSFVLCLFADELTKLNNWKNIIKKFGIILLAFLMTRSTMGYVVLGLILIVILANANIGMSARNTFVYPIILAAGTISIYYLYNSEAIQTKLEQKEDVKNTNSYQIRLADNIALLSCIRDKPFTGWGPDSKGLVKKLRIRGSRTDSNGILLATAELGIPYIILWIWAFLTGIIRIHGKRLGLGIGLALILSQMNEVGYFLPITSIYIYKYGAFCRKNKVFNNNSML